MSLNSYAFVFVFLPVAVSIFWLIADRVRQSGAFLWLIACSLVFYASTGFTGLVVVLPSIAFDYVIAKAMLHLRPDQRVLRGILFTTGIAANVALLGYLKYRTFFFETLGTLFATHFDLVQLLVPLGLSFLVFQKISFLSDIRSGQIQSVRFLDFLLFTLFFPRVIAGPVVRYGEIVPQFSSLAARRSSANLAIGLALFAIGLFKKSALADNVARLAPIDFAGTPSLYAAWMPMLAYTLQVYFDFSGYSDMALGVARMFGIKLPMNFNSPLKATSILDFWGRWHISLTRFLMDYIYTPMIMDLTRIRLREGKPVLHSERPTLGAIVKLIALPTFVTLVISGVWHGAGWPFVAWGVLHAIYVTINQTWRLFRPRLWPDRKSYDRFMKPVGFVLTFISVVIALVFFRAPSVSSAFGMVRAMLGVNGLFGQLDVLQRWGFKIDVIQLYVQPMAWIFGLLVAATTLPNSLEILQRFHPALDFAQDPRSLQARDLTSTRPSDAGTVHSMRDWRRVLSTLLQYKVSSLDRFTAIIAALLCVLGVASLSRAAPFFYAQF